MTAPTNPTDSSVPITLARFRGDFPAFVNPQTFPDEVINFWIMVASCQVNPERWGNMWSVGVELYVAHHVVIDVKNQGEVAVGSLPGLTRGAISSESVGPVSLSYDVNVGAEEDMGHWSDTTYGRRYINLARQMGAGPVQIGVGFNPNPWNGPAWPGPWTAFLPSMNN
jgi:hypothetical protein